MTRKRLFGTESAFQRWLRSEPQLDAQQRGIYICDVDTLVWRFHDGLFYFVEIKSRGGIVKRFQEEVLSILDQACRKVDGGIFNTIRGRRKVRFCGVFVLTLSDTEPDDSRFLMFGRIGGKLFQISKQELIAIFGGSDKPLAPDVWLANQELKVIQEGGDAA